MEATLASSVGGAFTLFRGCNSSLMLREKRGWLLKEADSPLLGWEVYAHKESVLEESGIALIADATKILAAGEEPGQSAPEPASRALLAASRTSSPTIRGGPPPACGPREAYQATAIALAARGRRRAARAFPSRGTRWSWHDPALAFGGGRR